MHGRLKNKAYACGYLAQCLDDEDPAIFLIALRHVIEAHGGMSKIAKAAGLNRESLYKALSLKGNPALRTIRSVSGALGLKMSFTGV
ncbi:MAG TPA: addiction module antidote protein [Fibrobacteria bacterium]|nr:addiction module antidote protein [Fibrobacteria bacterium]